MDAITQAVRESARSTINHPAFVSWFKGQKPAPGDLILINNSFVFRDVRTPKSDLYIAFRVSDGGKPASTPAVAFGLKINSDFKLVSAKARNLPTLISLQDAVEKQLHSLGLLVFILIGRVSDTTVLQEPLKSQAFTKLLWDPSQPKRTSVRGTHLLVSDVSDEELIWSDLEKHFRKSGEAPPPALREAIGTAIDRLQDRAVATLSLPGSGLASGPTMTDAIVQVLRQHLDSYKTALSGLKSSSTGDSSAQTEVLRIAYNFATDATTFLRLVVSICDLKPIVLWGTISEHHALSEAFRSLPWTRSRVKASLSSYVSIVADARNSAFHNLFPFRKSLDVDLPDQALKKASLRIFSEYSKKSANALRFQDKELVEVLFEFTRARYRRASFHFWQQNLGVMSAAISLFDKTAEFLKRTHRWTRTK